MPSVDRYLTDDEELIYVTRQHWTQLVGEFVVLCVTWAAAGALLWVLPSGKSWTDAARYVVLGVAALVSLWFWLIPLMKWRGTLYILTTKRVHTRVGFVNKTGRSIPLARINDISFAASLWERIIRCGTLKIESASEQGLLTLKHIPDPEGLKRTIYEAMDGDQEHRYGAEERISRSR
ncbi:PH domain-containing protein [Streptomyces sp. NPDC087422]|uniref:PH domain-containing protein n=1 Tax=Streptomyces sp. NPDC087422 TaxID=3365786 RepID=UPI0037F1A141